MPEFNMFDPDDIGYKVKVICSLFDTEYRSVSPCYRVDIAGLYLFYNMHDDAFHIGVYTDDAIEIVVSRVYILSGFLSHAQIKVSPDYIHDWRRRLERLYRIAHLRLMETAYTMNGLRLTGARTGEIFFPTDRASNGGPKLND